MKRTSQRCQISDKHNPRRIFGGIHHGLQPRHGSAVTEMTNHLKSVHVAPGRDVGPQFAQLLQIKTRMPLACLFRFTLSLVRVSHPRRKPAAHDIVTVRTREFGKTWANYDLESP